MNALLLKSKRYASRVLHSLEYDLENLRFLQGWIDPTDDLLDRLWYTLTTDRPTR